MENELIKLYSTENLEVLRERIAQDFVFRMQVNVKENLTDQKLNSFFRMQAGDTMFFSINLEIEYSFEEVLKTFKQIKP